MFSRFNAMKSTIHWPEAEKKATPTYKPPTTASDARLAAIDPSCSQTITASCLHQLYKTGGYVQKATKKNSIGITGYLEQFANFADLKAFYEEQVPEAANSTFEVVAVSGGLNSQTPDEAGFEANLDVQFAFGLTHPVPGTYWTTGGRPPFKPDLTTPENTNGESQLVWRLVERMLRYDPVLQNPMPT
jgi:tripeptidyl-peptidase-1